MVFEIAVAGPCHVVRMQSGYFLSRISERLLKDFEDRLLRLQAEEWESHVRHIMVAPGANPFPADLIE